MPLTRVIKLATATDEAAGFLDVDLEFGEIIIKLVSIGNSTDSSLGSIRLAKEPYAAGDPTIDLVPKTPTFKAGDILVWSGNIKLPKTPRHIIRGVFQRVHDGDSCGLLVWWELP